MFNVIEIIKNHFLEIFNKWSVEIVMPIMFDGICACHNGKEIGIRFYKDSLLLAVYDNNRIVEAGGRSAAPLIFEEKFLIHDKDSIDALDKIVVYLLNKITSPEPWDPPVLSWDLV